MFGREKEYDYRAADEKLTAETGKGLCLTYCIGACCRNMTYTMTNSQRIIIDGIITEEELKVLTSNTDPKSIIEEQTPGKAVDRGKEEFFGRGFSYYRHPSGRFTVGMEESCGNLKKDFSCSLYENRPNACRNVEIGDDVCKNSRKLMNLPSLEKVIPAKYLALRKKR